MHAPEETNVLLVDDDEAGCRLLAEVLERDGYRVASALSVDEALAKLDREGPFDAVLTDLRMPERSGLDLLKRVREREPDALVLVLTAFGDASAAGEAIRAGAYDFVSKPYDIATLRETLARALGRRRLASASRERHGTPPHPGNGTRDQSALVGHSLAIIDVMKTVARVAPTQASVLLLGETGTGKELVARTIHRYSERNGRRFVAVNCSALAEGLLESELFGHVRGAFTGDEIGDISPALQARLLRALQEHEIVPVGSEAAVKVDVRIIAATHRDLSALVRTGKFREDLYYRLNVVMLQLPPLRDRKQDIPLLLDHFLRELTQRHGRGPVALDPEAQRRLLAYDWPGNVRELQNVLERALVLAEQDVIGSEHLPAEVRPGSESEVRPGPPPDLGSGVLEPRPGGLLSLEEVERRHVMRVLEATGGSREEASRILGISRRTLTRMVQRWGLPPRRQLGG